MSDILSTFVVEIKNHLHNLINFIVMTTCVYNRNGHVTAFLTDDSVYDSKGRHRLWIQGINLYNEKGCHVGWIEGGVLYDSHNDVLGFTANHTKSLPSHPGLCGNPGFPGLSSLPGKPGFSGIPGRPGYGGWSSMLLEDYLSHI